jgi:hypothetical protein
MLFNVHSIDNSQIPTLLVAFFPLGGLYNILVYTRPNVSSLRRTDANLSWLKAFILVIRAGGEVPSRTETSSCFLCFRSSNDDNKNRSSPSQISGIAKRGYYYSNRNPPAVERKSEVNMASLNGVDSSSLYLDDLENTDDQFFDVGGCSVTRLEVTSPSLERDEEGGNMIVGGHVLSEHFADCSSSDRPVLLVRLQGGDVSNISSIVGSDVAEMEDTKHVS